MTKHIARRGDGFEIELIGLTKETFDLEKQRYHGIVGVPVYSCGTEVCPLPPPHEGWTYRTEENPVEHGAEADEPAAEPAPAPEAA